MTPQQVVDVFMSTIYAATEISLPLLIVALAIGLLVSIFQAATQINEATLTFLPKIAAMIAVLVLTAPWMVQKMTEFTTKIYAKIPEITRMNK